MVALGVTITFIAETVHEFSTNTRMDTHIFAYSCSYSWMVHGCEPPTGMQGSNESR